MWSFLQRCVSHAPSFRLAYGLAIVVLLLFVLWVWLDCSFRWLPHLAAEDLRLHFVSDPEVRAMHGWSILGPRMLILAVLALLGTACVLVVFLRLILGTESERSILNMMLATALVAAWAAFFASYNQLWWIAFQHRIFKYQERLKVAAAVLSKDWSRKQIVLPGLGRYTFNAPTGYFGVGDGVYFGVEDSNYEDKYVDPKTTFHEVVGATIWREEDFLGFDVGSNRDWWVLCMKEGRSPRSSFPRYACGMAEKLERAVEIEADWYLVHLVYSKLPTAEEARTLIKQDGTERSR